MSTNRPIGDPQLFLVRVWLDGAQFRAAVRATDDAEPRLFTAAQPLAEFLRGAASGEHPTAPASATVASRRTT